MKLQTKFSLGIVIVSAMLAAVIVMINIHDASRETFGTALVFYLAVLLIDAAAVVLMSYWLLKGIRGSIQDLSRATKQISLGDLSCRVPVERNDELGELLVSFNQMAERLEEQRSDIESRQQELETLNLQLQATNRNYMEMLGFVSHELKNPLTSAVMSLHTVMDGYLGDISPAQTKSLASVAQSLAYFQDMIRDYLDLSRLEKGELEVCKTYIPLHTRVVDPVLVGLAGELQQRRMAIEDRILHGKVVYADAGLLRIVYDNLLSNAVKYGLEGGTILLDAQENGSHVILSVRNDSSGISPDKLPQLFRKFSRLDSPEHLGKRGTGLGLYVCKEIVEKHGGQIWAESQMGEWVKFSFSLPKQGQQETDDV